VFYVAGLQVAGLQVAGLQVAGLQVAGLQVAGLQVAGLQVERGDVYSHMHYQRATRFTFHASRFTAIRHPQFSNPFNHHSESALWNH
jgi:hypothetical protein